MFAMGSLYVFGILYKEYFWRIIAGGFQLSGVCSNSLIIKHVSYITSIIQAILEFIPCNLRLISFVILQNTVGNFYFKSADHEILTQLGDDALIHLRC